jgi:hypothetical protein
VPAESAFSTAFWIGASSSAIAACVAVFITPIGRRRVVARSRTEPA